MLVCGERVTELVGKVERAACMGLAASIGVGGGGGRVVENKIKSRLSRKIQ